MAKHGAKQARKCANLTKSRKAGLKSNKKIPKGQNLDKFHYGHGSCTAAEQAPKKIW